MRKSQISSFGLALTVAALGLTGCGGGSGDPAPVVLPAKQSAENYVVSGVLKETDGLAMPGSVALTATDANGNPVKLYSDKTGGNLITSAVTVGDDGMLSFFVDKNALLPVTIKAAGSTLVPNHIASSTKFTVTQPSTFFVINIVDMDFPAAGILPHYENGTMDADDKLQVPFDMIISSTRVTIPSGTIFQTAGNANLKGTVKAAVTQFTSSTTTSDIIPATISGVDIFTYDPNTDETEGLTLPQSDLENFPGGMNSALIGGNSGYFTTAGFVAVEVIDANGNQAKKLASGTFAIRMNISPGVANPLTDLPVQAGDVIPVFTYDENTMSWVPDGSETVLQDGTGLYVIHNTNHFSFWNLGWAVTGTTASCSATINVPAPTSTAPNDAFSMPLNLKATLTPVKVAGSRTKVVNTLLTGTKPAFESSLSLTSVPNQALDVVFTDSTNKVIFTKTGVNLCTAATPLSVVYNAPAVKSAVAVTVNVTEYCSLDSKVTQVVPNTLTTVTTSVTNVGKIPPVAYTPIASGVTGLTGTFIYNLKPTTGTTKYTISAYDRRTAKFVTATAPISVVKGTPQVVNIGISVTCNKVSGSSGLSF
jgi:hypothetical protein